MPDESKAPTVGYRAARSIEPTPMFSPRSTYDLGGGVLVITGLFEPHGDWGFRAIMGLERFQSSDCAWDEEMARAMGTKAAILRFVEGRQGSVPFGPGFEGR